MKDDTVYTIAGMLLVLALIAWGFAGWALWVTAPDLNTTTIHKQDRLPVACQEGAQ